METANYILKEIQPEDIHHIHKGLSNPEITKYYDVHFETLEETESQMQWYRDLKTEGKGAWWGIFDKSDDQFCGAGGFNEWEKDHRKAEIGLWLLKEHWGKGIMKEIMPKLFEIGFTDMNLNRIEGYVVSDNSKCKRAIEKINFQLEGTMREYEFVDGQSIDVDIYAILRRNWKG